MKLGKIDINLRNLMVQGFNALCDPIDWYNRNDKLIGYEIMGKDELAEAIKKRYPVAFTIDRGPYIGGGCG